MAMLTFQTLLSSTSCSAMRMPRALSGLVASAPRSSSCSSTTCASTLRWPTWRTRRYSAAFAARCARIRSSCHSTWERFMISCLLGGDTWRLCSISIVLYFILIYSTFVSLIFFELHYHHWLFILGITSPYTKLKKGIFTLSYAETKI